MGQDEWEKLEGEKNFWNPTTKGEELKGQIIEITQGMYGSKYTIKTEKGTVTTPSHKMLQSRLSGTKAGDEVRIVYEGTTPPAIRGQNPMANYSVYKRKTTTVTEERVQ